MMRRNWQETVDDEYTRTCQFNKLRLNCKASKVPENECRSAEDELRAVWDTRESNATYCSAKWRERNQASVEQEGEALEARDAIFFFF